jgi:hypothetical protein
MDCSVQHSHVKETVCIIGRREDTASDWCRPGLPPVLVGVVCRLYMVGWRDSRQMPKVGIIPHFQTIRFFLGILSPIPILFVRASNRLSVVAKRRGRLQFDVGKIHCHEAVMPPSMTTLRWHPVRHCYPPWRYPGWCPLCQHCKRRRGLCRSCL